MNCILFYNGVYPSGSWPQRIRLTSKALSEIGVINDIVISFWPPTLKEKSASGNNVRFLFKPVTTHKYKSNKVLYLVYYLLGVLKSYFYIRKKRNLDFVYFAQGSFLECILILLYCKKYNIKFVLDLVDENAKKYEKRFSNLIDVVGILNRELYDRIIVKRSDLVFTISSYLHNKYNLLFPELQIRASIPSLIDSKKYEIKRLINLTEELIQDYSILINKPNKFVYAGSCVRPNGIFFFLENLVEVSSRLNFDYYVLLFVKEGDINPLRVKIDQLCISDKVLIHNPVDQEYLPAIYSRLSDYLVLPEQGDIAADAGFPSKTAELLYSERPIIATEFSDISLYLKNGYNALLSQRGDKEAYQFNLAKLIYDKKLCKTLTANAKRTALEYFSYSLWGERIVDSVNQLR